MLSNGAPPQLRNGSAASNGMSRDVPFKHMSTGSLNIPNGLGPQNGANNGQPQIMGPIVPGQRLDGPRSPPSKQSEQYYMIQASLSWLHANWLALADTSHVPCKFFRQGACQAGKACPFSHDLASTTDNVCKYFAKVCYSIDFIAQC
jgi:hypothetical protein